MIIAAIGGAVAFKLKVPAGMMIGAMAAAAFFNIFTQMAYVPENTAVYVRIAAGAMIGCRMTKKDARELKTMIVPSVILILSFIILGISFGFLIHYLSNLDLTTALFASAPGGMSDMALIADELGGDAPKVALLQLMRIMAILGIFPIVLKFLCKRFTKDDKVCEPTDKENEDKEAAAVLNKKEYVLWFIITMLVSSAGGLLGYWADIPAGVMIGSMVFVAVFQVIKERAVVPVKMRIFTQLFVGAMIGSGMTMNDITGLREIILPAVILILGLIVINIIIGFVIRKFCRYSVATCLFASAPGGIIEMTLIADEMGADTPKVALLQLVRLMSVIILFPVFLRYIHLLLL